jgi:hypothetical protein
MGFIAMGARLGCIPEMVIHDVELWLNSGGDCDLCDFAR